MKQNGLKSALWDAANTLRGSAVDRTDWKGYILPLLFFKRISDVWDEETAEAAEAFGDVDPTLFPEVHRFTVPDGCHWNDVRDTASNVGAALLRAMRGIERANPDTLFRVFGTADWGNKEKFPQRQLLLCTDDNYNCAHARCASHAKTMTSGSFDRSSLVDLVLSAHDEPDSIACSTPRCSPSP